MAVPCAAAHTGACFADADWQGRRQVASNHRVADAEPQGVLQVRTIAAVSVHFC